MTDVELDQLVPPTINLRAGTGKARRIVATLPGEIDVVRMLEITRLQEIGAQHERVLLDLPDTEENREERAVASQGVREFYEQAAAIIDAVATVAEGETLTLTGTQIVAIVSMLIAPAQRMQLLATAYLMAVGVEFDEDGVPIPLGEGSGESSSRSGDTADGPEPTGARSSGASGSRSATPRKRTPRPSSSNSKRAR